MPEKGATLRARVLGYNWERQGQRSIMECGLFVLDDVSFSDAPTTLQVGGVSKPSDSDFSELERDVIWKNTSIKRIGAKIAARYGLAFTYDADDYDIECDEPGRHGQQLLQQPVQKLRTYPESVRPAAVGV